MQLYPGKYFFIFQVYLPCSNHPVEWFYDYLLTLYDLYNLYCDKGVTIFMGDLNAKLAYANSYSSRDRNLYMTVT